MTRTKIEAITHGVRIVTEDETLLFFAVGQQVYGTKTPTGEFHEAPDNWPGNGIKPGTYRVCRGLRRLGTPIYAGDDLLQTIRDEWRVARRDATNEARV